MRVRITMPAKDGKRLKEQVLQGAEKVEDEDWGEEWEVVCAVTGSWLINLTLQVDYAHRPRSIPGVDGTSSVGQGAEGVWAD
jgi:hypothetical protein